jgi:hypothetical protein
MPLEVSKIDEQIRKLHQLKKIAEDREFVDLFQEFLTTRKGDSRPSGKAKHPVKSTLYVPRKGSFTEAVLDACLGFGAKKFTARDIIRTLKEIDYKIEAKNPYTAVLGILKKLVDRHRLTVTEAAGRNPYVYENA